MTEKDKIADAGTASASSACSTPDCGKAVYTVSGGVLPCGLPRGHKGHHLNLFDMHARCESQIRRAVQFGAEAAQRGDVQDGWLADKTLKQLRAIKAGLDKKLKESNSELNRAGGTTVPR